MSLAFPNLLAHQIKTVRMLTEKANSLSQVEKNVILQDPLALIAYCTTQTQNSDLSLSTIYKFVDRYMGDFESFDTFCHQGHNPDLFYPVLKFDRSGVHVFRKTPSLSKSHRVG